ncbi:DUF4945 domain-containing protein [Niabella beijingensis]|uniref:DUF4945 domain-containing protein n=1 Tax=Niabella beijingensis TaxID=2872700 RepID=UPI001CBE2BFA|nr:DUF4945 domain-containing protein [Niabella beijingensis]MBZ4187333.1 DUF4945 domain-containing protein [Niabella beijingensis]
MKAFIFAGCFFLLVACNKREITDRKEGSISLPPVENLTLQKLTDSTMKLTWNIPALPESIEQPVSVFILVKEIQPSLASFSPFSTTLDNAPTTFTYEVPDKPLEDPDAKRKYHITVKIKGTTVRKDPNYSGEVYSPGQTVAFDE